MLTAPGKSGGFFIEEGMVLSCYLCYMLYFNCDGKIIRENTPVITADNRGFRYGDGLFETLKFTRGKILFSNEHFARLWKGMQLLHFIIPKHFTPEMLEEQMLDLVKKNGHEGAARIRLTIYRGDGGLYDAVNHAPHYIIQSWPLQEGTGELNSNGLVLGFYEAAKKSVDVFSNLKNNNYLPYIMAALKAKEEKWNDAIVLNNFNRVCDTTIANLFIIKDNEVFTPSLAEGCVAGVMREILMDTLKKQGWAITEKGINVEEVMEADEIFLTNSIYNIRWVKELDNKDFGNALVQKIYSTVISTIS